MELIKIPIHELEAFTASEWFRALPDKPISYLRVTSYLNNPHALPEDIVLYCLYEKDRVLAYRTVFPARLSSGERFAWLSGNWVHPEYRRQGLSKRLLAEIDIDWNRKLMFTNYAPASLNLYLQTGLFHKVYSEGGFQFYQFLSTRNFLNKRFPKMSFLWPFADIVLKWMILTRLFFTKVYIGREFTVKKSQFPDEACYQLAEEQKTEYLFLRGKSELKWILDYPWVSSANKQNIRDYNFSSWAKQFEYRTVKFYKDSILAGFLLYSIRDGHLKTLHQHFSVDCYQVAARFLIREMVQGRFEFMTVLQPQLAKAIDEQKNTFLARGKRTHDTYASFPVDTIGKKIQDGDGDYIFT